MILGVGTDIIEISRIKKAIENESFLKKVYTDCERIEAEHKGINSVATYAGKFCAKEAISKALGTGIRDFKLQDIEILSDKLGKPNVYFKGELANKMEDNKIEISISHCKEYATAVALLLKGEKLNG